MADLSRIRNFSIIAHIDHGKSTLADRLIQLCGGLAERDMKEQVLDSMDIERERGITIKAQAVRLNYTAKDGETYELNLMDTPGHVDFAYEVSRSLAACEGSLLVVDASQGVEAQTLANVYQAIEAQHEIVPILNKVDLPAADVPRVKEQIEDVIGIDASDAVEISAKTGLGVPDVLEALVKRLPPPQGDTEAPLQAMLVDSWYDSYLGVIILIRVKHGRIKRGMKVLMMQTGAVHQVDKVGVFTPKMLEVPELHAGQMGFMMAGIKTVADTQVGDTITNDAKPAKEPLPGFKPSIPVVWCGLFPIDASDYEHLRDSLAKLRLNDSSFDFQPENSAALGFGFRCGFLGLLHMEIIQERLDREFNLDLITTAPSVVYRMNMTNGDVKELHNPADFPDQVKIASIEEPWVKATIMVPDEYLGNILALCTERRGEQIDLTYVGNRAMAVYRLPLNEIVFDFYDRLKSISKGYASFDYEVEGYTEGDLVKVSILVHAEPVDAQRARALADVDATHGGLWFPHAGAIRPQVVCAALLSNASSPITRLTAEVSPPQLGDDGLWQVAGHFFDAVVLTAGVFSQTLWPAAELPIVCNRGQISLIAQGPEPLPGPALSFGGYLSPAFEDSAFGDGQTLRVLGATYRRLPTADSEDWRTLRDEDHQAVADGLATHFPAVAAALQPLARLLGGRTALRAAIADHMPLAGPLFDADQFRYDFAELHHGRRPSAYPQARWSRGLYILGGLGSRGFQTAPLLAEHMAALMTGQASPLSEDLIEAVHPARFLLRRLRKAPTWAANGQKKSPKPAGATGIT